MADPTKMREYRLPTGDIMWIDPAAADAALAEKGIDPMANKATGVGDTGNELVECTKTGRYQVGAGVFRYMSGDKIPRKATYLADAPPKKVNEASPRKRPRKVATASSTGDDAGSGETS